jgi:hypothetical protein
MKITFADIQQPFEVEDAALILKMLHARNEERKAAWDVEQPKVSTGPSWAGHWTAASGSVSGPAFATADVSKTSMWNDAQELAGEGGFLADEDVQAYVNLAAKPADTAEALVSLDEETTGEATVEPVKRRGGRPKGSKNGEKKQTKAAREAGIEALSRVDEAPENEDTFSFMMDEQKDEALVEEPEVSGDSIEDMFSEYEDADEHPAAVLEVIDEQLATNSSTLDPDLEALFADLSFDKPKAGPYDGWLHDQLQKELTTRMISSTGKGAKWYMAEFSRLGGSGINSLTDPMMRELLTLADNS